MKVKIVFEPTNDRETAAIKLVTNNVEVHGDAERIHRILGALIDILKLSIVP